MAVMVMVVIFETQKIPPVRELGFFSSYSFCSRSSNDFWS